MAIVHIGHRNLGGHSLTVFPSNASPFSIDWPFHWYIQTRQPPIEHQPIWSVLIQWVPKIDRSRESAVSLLAHSPPFEWFSREKETKTSTKHCVLNFFFREYTSALLSMCFSDFNFNWNTSEYANRLVRLISFLSINKWVNGGYWAKPKCCVSACAGARAHTNEKRKHNRKSLTRISTENANDIRFIFHFYQMLFVCLRSSIISDKV